MAVINIGSGWLTGLETDSKPLPSSNAIGMRFIEFDTLYTKFTIYVCDGVQWIPQRDFPEEFTHKTIDYNLNTLTNLPSGSGGSGGSDTMSNVGVSGFGLYKQKLGSNFELKNLDVDSSKLNIFEDFTGGVIILDVVETNLTLNNIGGTLGTSKGGTGQTTVTAGFDALSPMTTLGDIIYGGTSGTRTRLTGNTTTTQKFLAQTGNGSVSAAPVWTTVSDLAANIQFSGDITPSQITSNQNDYNPTGLSTAGILRLSTDASRNITGLAGGTDGRIIVIHNVGAFDVVLKNQDTGSTTAGDRFLFGADSTIAADKSATLWYDSTSSRWRMLVSPGAGGGSGEINTASNVGVGGVGVFKQKTGVNLEFKNINAGSSYVTITNDVGNNEVDVDLAATVAKTDVANTFSIHQQLDDYLDVKKITIPANPATDYARFYVKQVDANNDGVFVKIKRTGGFVEVQVV